MEKINIQAFIQAAAPKIRLDLTPFPNRVLISVAQAKAAIKEILDKVLDKAVENANTKWTYIGQSDDSIIVVDPHSILNIKNQIEY